VTSQLCYLRQLYLISLPFHPPVGLYFKTTPGRVQGKSILVWKDEVFKAKQGCTGSQWSFCGKESRHREKYVSFL
jgi:hypothetical protein